MDASDDGPVVVRRVRVHGRVQGVGYRYACVRRAHELGLDGWVRNRVDGSVEALLQGPQARVTRMCAWMRDGVPGARVDGQSVDDVTGEDPAPRGFEARPTA